MTPVLDLLYFFRNFWNMSQNDYHVKNSS